MLACGLVEAGYVLLRARHPLPQGRTWRSLWAIGLVTLGLAFFADFVPQVAGPFAVLVLIAMAVRSKGELGQVIGAAGASSGVPSSSPAPTPHTIRR